MISEFEKILTKKQKFDLKKFGYYFFKNKEYNLNCSNLGNTFFYAKRENLKNISDLSSDAVANYEFGRTYIKKLKKEIYKFVKLKNYILNITMSSSMASSLISASLKKNKYNVVTSKQEHIGGLSSFENNKSKYNISKIEYINLLNFEYLKKIKKPDILFLSHVFYDNGIITSVNDVIRNIKQINKKCIIIIDAAQSFGVIDISGLNADIIFASSHKWIFGPKGMGIILIKKSSYNFFEKVFYGSKLDEKNNKFDLVGGHDFIKYYEFYLVIKLFNNIKLNFINKRTFELKNFFLKKISKIKNIEILNFNPQHPGIIIISIKNNDTYKLYNRLKNKKVYLKCFAEKSQMRISIPFYETTKRLSNAAKIISEEIK